MEKFREIPKDVEAPPLIGQAVPLINDLLFGTQNTLEEIKESGCETLLIFGTSSQINIRQLKKTFFKIYDSIPLKFVFMSGGPTSMEDPEAIVIHKEITSDRNLSSLTFRMDPVSVNTLENVKNAHHLGLKKHSNFLFLSKWPHCGRCQLTLRKFFPSTTIFQMGYTTFLSESMAAITPENWIHSPVLQRLIWAEFLRIEHYGSRGDIYYPETIQKKVQEVWERVKNPTPENLSDQELDNVLGELVQARNLLGKDEARKYLKDVQDIVGLNEIQAGRMIKTYLNSENETRKLLSFDKINGHIMPVIAPVNCDSILELNPEC